MTKSSGFREVCPGFFREGFLVHKSLVVLSPLNLGIPESPLWLFLPIQSTRHGNNMTSISILDASFMTKNMKNRLFHETFLRLQREERRLTFTCGTSSIFSAQHLQNLDELDHFSHPNIPSNHLRKFPTRKTSRFDFVFSWGRDMIWAI